MKLRVSIVLLFILLTGLLLQANAQMTTGSILGTVRDASGAVVAGATVTVVDNGKGTSKSDVSDAQGEYNIPFLLPGTYNVTITMKGFKTSISSNITVDIDQKARIDVTLEPGGSSETVRVEATAPLIKLESSETGDVIGKTQVQNLPLNGRDFAQLTYLVPGVTAGQAGENLGGSSSFNPRAAVNFNTLGSQANSNAYLVDGIVDNEYTFNTVMVQPSVESIAEFKVLTGSYSAEYGGGAGVLSVSTRSGADQLHGELFLYLRNSAVDARNYFATAGETLQPAYRRGQFGGAVAGPIIHNKLFYFADYYGQRSLKGITNLNSVPTAAERTGDFSDFRDASGNLIPIYDPLTTVASGTATPTYSRSQFMGCDGLHPNVICSNRLSQVGLNVASIYPLPQTAGSFNNFTSVANQIIDDNGGNVRIDYHLSPKDSMFGRWSYEEFVQASPNPLTGGQGTCCLPTPPSAAAQFDLGPYVAGIQNIDLKAQGLSLNETHIFTPELFNEFRAGYARTNPFTFQSDYGHDSSTSLGIQGLNVSQYTTGLPNFTIGNSCGAEFTCLQGGTAFLPAHPVQTNIQVEDNVTSTKGPNTLKVGFRFVRIYASPFTNTTTRGGLTFNTNFTNSGTSSSGGSGLAAILLGFPNAGSRNFLIKPYYVTSNIYSAFVQDDWKVSPRLTMNMGLRYDVFTPDVEKNDQLANFDYQNLVFVFAGQNGVSRTAGVQTRYGNVGPRFGFAYDLDGKGSTVIRGGFGISYFLSPASASDELGQNPPFTVSQTFASPTTYPLPASFSAANQCSATNLSSTCQPVLNNPFPAGVVTVPIASLTNTTALNAAAPAIVSHSMTNKTPSMQTYTLNVQRQLLGGVFSVGYAGSHTAHINYSFNPNEVGLIQPNGPTSQTARRLIQPLNRINTWVEQEPINSSNYNSLQVEYIKRYSHGLTAIMDYTYSKSLDYGGSAASGGGAAGNPQTVTNLHAGYGASGFDQKHRFVSSINYELPFGANRAYFRDGMMSHVLGGFEVDAITTYGSGEPFSVSLNSGVNSGAPSWPNRIGRRGKIDHGNPRRFFNASLCPTGQSTLADGAQCAFVIPEPNTYGNVGRSVLYGPSTKNWDMSLQRRFGIYKEKQLALKLDAFNIFNTPNFSTPNTALGSATAGTITGTVNDNRDLQASFTFYF
ncbi:carboxypeptidase regulatory-like domain-containing protein [Silvibacterium acidisoli]|uniref:carboxypeptidase regulatory-like domain-containing protein n=1 Tax=Acidobacteriaceae bacterium ZG23-2 TaxID=2883246 RepID=UPI00406C978A